MAFYQTDVPQLHSGTYYSRKERAWVQNGERVRKVKHPPYAFIWPKDGKNGSKWGRFKDIMTNSGPDMYVSISAKKQNHMNNRPERFQWAGYADPDDDEDDFLISPSLRAKSWTKNGALGGRAPGLVYDFRTRQYGKPNRHMWTDVVWDSRKSHDKKSKYPDAIRDHRMMWYQRHTHPPWAIEEPFPWRRGMSMPGFRGMPYARATAEAGFM